MYNAKTLAMIQEQERELRRKAREPEPEEFRVPFDPVVLIDDWASLSQAHVESMIEGGHISRVDAYTRWALALRAHMDSYGRKKE